VAVGCSKDAVVGASEPERVGEVLADEEGAIPFVVVDEAGRPVECFSSFLRELVIGDASPLTCKSYGHDLLRWWRLLRHLEVAWDRATRSEVEVLVGWLRVVDIRSVAATLLTRRLRGQ
jgi:hypothetical protein